MFNFADNLDKEYRQQVRLMDKMLSAHNAMSMRTIIEEDQARLKMMNEIMASAQQHRALQDAGAKASVESHKLLKQQLEEQTEINQRLEREFKMSAREAVITRKIACWSLVMGVVGVIVAILAFFRS